MQRKLSWVAYSVVRVWLCGVCSVGRWWHASASASSCKHSRCKPAALPGCWNRQLVCRSQTTKRIVCEAHCEVHRARRMAGLAPGPPAKPCMRAEVTPADWAATAGSGQRAAIPSRLCSEAWLAFFVLRWVSACLGCLPSAALFVFGFSWMLFFLRCSMEAKLAEASCPSPASLPRLSQVALPGCSLSCHFLSGSPLQHPGTL